MDETTVVLAWTLGVVLLVAAAGKIAAPSSPRDVLVATGEGLLSAVVMLGVIQLVAGLFVAATAVAYCIYAFVRRGKEECTCFGRHLPASSRATQRARNSLLAGLAIAYVVVLFVNDPSSPPPASVFWCGLGVLSGAVIVVAPWLVEWAFAPARLDDRGAARSSDR